MTTRSKVYRDFGARQQKPGAVGLHCICYRPCVCPSHGCLDQLKTHEVRIIQFSEYGSPIPPTFRGASFIQKF